MHVVCQRTGLAQFRGNAGGVVRAGAIYAPYRCRRGSWLRHLSAARCVLASCRGLDRNGGRTAGRYPADSGSRRRPRAGRARFSPGWIRSCRLVSRWLAAGRRARWSRTNSRARRGGEPNETPLRGSSIPGTLCRARRLCGARRLRLERAAAHGSDCSSGCSSGCRSGCGAGRGTGCTGERDRRDPDLDTRGSRGTPRPHRAVPGPGALADADRIHQSAGSARRGQLAAAEPVAQGRGAR